MREALVKIATFVFLGVELICLLMGLPAEQVLLRSVPVYVLLLVAGSIIIGILEKVEEKEAGSQEEASSIDVQVGDASMAAAPVGDPAAAGVEALSEKNAELELGESIKKTAQQKPEAMAQAISSVMKNE